MPQYNAELVYDFDYPRQLVVQFSELELSSDAGIPAQRVLHPNIKTVLGIS